MVTPLFIVNCQLSDLRECEVGTVVSKLKTLSQLYIIDSSLKDQSVCTILQMFQAKDIEVTVIDALPVKGDTLYNFVTDRNFYYNAKVHFVVVMENFLFGNNLSIKQLNLLKSNYFTECNIVPMATAVKYRLLKMFVF